jgi:c-di-GMP-binding flagellar brake protein YcgR
MIVGDLFQEKGLTLNISAGGCVIAVVHTPEKGQHLHLMLQIPNPGMPIKIQLVVVRWKAPDLFGVEFIRLTSLNQKGLQHYLHMIDLNPS